MTAVETPPPIPEDLLLRAYRIGIFPMADTRDDPEMFWVEPKRRAILPLDGFVCSRSLARTLRRGRFFVTCDTAFAEVLDACAAPRISEGGQTWISHRIAESYRRLHAAGHAHSIECWISQPNAPAQLVGGLYGVGFGRVFCGESMFSRVPDASKVALAWLVAALRMAGAELLDCQFLTPHLASLGAVEISQKRYLELLNQAQKHIDHRPGDHRPEDQRPDQRGASASPASASPGPGGGATGAVSAAALSLPAGFAALAAAAASAGFSSSPGNFIAQSFTQTS